MQNHRTIGIFGAGSIAVAMLDGILSQNIINPEDIYVTNKQNDEKLHALREKYNVHTTRDYKEILSNCRYLIIAVKPIDIDNLLKQLKNDITDNHIIITLAAGVATSYVEDALGKKIQVIRAMPNTACKVRESATAIALGRYAKEEARNFAEEIFSSVGKVSIVEEDMMDAVTGLSGSGPAYVYLLMDALIEAGVKAGIPRPLSEELTVQTVYGAAKMVVETGQSPSKLRSEVTTPGGTTMAGMKVLENADFIGLIVKTVESAAKRSAEMMQERNSKCIVE
ncbi:MULTISPECIES: pyrroline-5-carboxylate reductase [Tepidanaerobacter]|uniref:pyrroline-5-carboxylate reductase n=1 Tax=Tepidanaerobacter TaxID=499228 RepID=UPI000AA9745E|nr:MULTISPECIES: pyrroline-5-carboxylate reductase [Tepidanaerobacter]GLI51251.1 pyrroline-5-carboxylate reductase [Tepidanaerobacter syntrophicus]HHV82300.1 pyrroline-5-carboxylate reductase [Tepidanaerobacter syntrophicus]